MKVMEAPEKIYLFENPIDGTPDYRWLSKRSCSDDVEYIRTDAFIEKATSYIQQHWIWNTKMIEDFKNYMKGE
jgi:hypothetical protein